MGEKIKIFIDYGKWEDQTGQTKDNIIKRLTKEIEALKEKMNIIQEWIRVAKGNIVINTEKIEVLENKIKSEFFSVH